MRNFSKTLISMAAVMAVGSAMAAGAMAADLTATYAGDTVTFSGVTEGKSQYTLLVVEGTKAEDAAEYTYDATEATIKQIDQNDAGVAFTEAIVGTLADGSYKVMVGNNDGTVDEGIFTVGGAVQTTDYYVGDANGDGSVASGDVTMMVRHFGGFGPIGKIGTTVGKTKGDANLADDTTVLYGDANLDGSVASGDVTMMVRHFGGFGPIGKIGTPVKVVVE